jgi:hypothetical protein
MVDPNLLLPIADDSEAQRYWKLLVGFLEG